MAQNMSPALLGTEKISKLLVNYSLPAIVAMTAASLYNMVDSIFIGHGVGALAISGLAITLPIVNITTAFGALVGVGASTLLSVKLGQKDYDSANHILGNVVLLNTIIGVSVSVVMLIFLEKILFLFGASSVTMPYAKDYMQIILAGNVITHIYMGLNDILRASGYPMKAMVATITAVLINCVFNWIFIFVLDYGIRGAAIATILAQVLALGVEVVHFLNPNSYLHFKKGMISLQRHIVKGVLSIGMSPFLMYICASMVVMLINTNLQNHGGDLAVGAYGVTNRVAMLFVMIVFGLNQGLQPIAGYNFGARKYDRVTTVFRYTVIAGVSVTTTGFLLSQIFPRQIAYMFTTDEALIEQSTIALKSVLLMFPFVGFQIVTANFFQSIGMAGKAIFLSLTRQMLFLIPLLLTLPVIWGTKGVWLSMPIADGFAVITSTILLIRQFKQFKTHANT